LKSAFASFVITFIIASVTFAQVHIKEKTVISPKKFLVKNASISLVAPLSGTLLIGGCGTADGDICSIDYPFPESAMLEVVINGTPKYEFNISPDVQYIPPAPSYANVQCGSNT